MTTKPGVGQRVRHHLYYLLNKVQGTLGSLDDAPGHAEIGSRCQVLLMEHCSTESFTVGHHKKGHLKYKGTMNDH